MRVGGNEELRVDVRLIAATNRDIIEAIQQNQFREDLYHRLNVVQFRPPPLRERGGDIQLLALHFLKQFSVRLNRPIRGISAPAQSRLGAHHWPGNVRELRNVMERAVILETDSEVQPSNLPDFEFELRLRKSPGAAIPDAPAGAGLEQAIEHYERQLILTTLDQHQYNLAKSADQLRITRHALRYRMNRLNLGGGNATDDETTSGTRS
jgi:DNA-binding NtrC family response regulator